MPVQIINPNLHVILIHTPISMLVIGTLIELFSFLWRRSGFRAAGRWMILIGALATIPACTTGMYAAQQAIGNEGSTWKELKASAPLSNEVWEHLTWHTRCNAAGAILCTLLIVTWIGSSDYWRGKLHLIFMLVLIIAVGLFTFGAWNGGEMVYSHRVGTQLVKGGWQSTPPSNSDTTAATQTSPEKGKALFTALNTAANQFGKFDNVLDIHAMLAGCTFALALVTLGLSIRAISISPRIPITDSMARDEDIVEALTPRTNAPVRNALLETSDLPTDDTPPEKVPSARFWLLTALIGILTALGGLMVFGADSFNDLWDMLQKNGRDMAHGIVGVAIILLSLILALVTRFARTNKILIAGFAVLLLAAIAIQFWFAFLLLFDGSPGPWNHLN